MSVLLQADPVLIMLPSAFFTLLFGISATHKLTSWQIFQGQVADYRIFSHAWTDPAAALIVVSEVLLALGWLANSTRIAAAILSGVLFVLYGAAMAWNLVQGRNTIDCGCGVDEGAQVIRPALVMRNLLLAVVAVMPAFALESVRTIGWVDWITVLGGALGLLGMYLSTNQILANLPPQRMLD